MYTALGHKLRLFYKVESAICDRGYYIHEDAQMKLMPPPSGGDEHPPAVGCGWGVFAVVLV